MGRHTGESAWHGGGGGHMRACGHLPAVALVCVLLQGIYLSQRRVSTAGGWVGGGDGLWSAACCPCWNVCVSAQHSTARGRRGGERGSAQGIWCVEMRVTRDVYCKMKRATQACVHAEMHQHALCACLHNCLNTQSSLGRSEGTGAAYACHWGYVGTRTVNLFARLHAAA